MQKAYPFLVALFTFALCTAYFGSAIAQEQDSSPVSFEQTEYVMDDLAPGVQEKLEVTLTNNQEFEAASLPDITYTSFKLNDDGNPVLVDEDDASKWLAGEWINGPVRLTNLADEAVNILELVVIVPDDAETGAYRGAVSIDHEDWDDPINSWIVLNVGTDDADLDIVEDSDDTFLNFDDDQVSAVLRNTGQHYIHPSVSLVLRAGDDGEKQEIELSAQQSIGILPDSEQIFTPAGEVSFEEAIVNHSDLIVAVVISQSDEEIDRLDFPGIEPATDPEDEDGSDDQEADDDQASDDGNTGSSSDKSSSDGFLGGSASWIIVAGSSLVVVLLAVLLWLSMRHRSTRMPPGDQVKPQVITGSSEDDDSTTDGMPSPDGGQPTVDLKPADEKPPEPETPVVTGLDAQSLDKAVAALDTPSPDPKPADEKPPEPETPVVTGLDAQSLDKAVAALDTPSPDSKPADEKPPEPDASTVVTPPTIPPPDTVTYPENGITPPEPKVDPSSSPPPEPKPAPEPPAASPPNNE